MKLVPNAVSRRVGRTILISQKNSPKALFVVGTVGVVATVVLAARATLKLEDVLDELDDSFVEINATITNEEERKRALIVAHVKGYTKIAKLYSPAIIVGVGSISALAGSHNILTKRNAALTAAYAGAEKAFDEYRARVREEFGEEKDLEFKRGIKHETVANEKGKEIEVPYVDTNGISQYARIFAKHTNPNWEPRKTSNEIFLRGVQGWANHRLHAVGHVLLNDVYDALGYDRSPQGALVGWAVNKGVTNGDGFVDFGIYEVDAERARLYDEDTNAQDFLLDFNVDGVVWDQI